MKYISTRRGADPQPFCDILLGGLAPDGGFYLPDSYPQVGDHLIKGSSLELNSAIDYFVFAAQGVIPSE